MNNVIAMNGNKQQPKKQLKKLKYIDNILKLSRMLPVSFAAEEIETEMDGDKAKILFLAFMEANPNNEQAKAFDLANFDKGPVKVKTVQLVRIIHSDKLKEVKNQKQLDEYVSWVALNNFMIAKHYPMQLKEAMQKHHDQYKK